jgi:xanthine dehydrogenase accessory factor
VHVPVGLDLGHTSHREIAVAVLAELVQLRAAGSLAPARSTGDASAAQEPATAIDPVCGMTVAADPSSHPLVHDGVTHYFCRAGCRDRFEADPSAYANADQEA